MLKIGILPLNVKSVIMSKPECNYIDIENKFIEACEYGRVQDVHYLFQLSYGVVSPSTITKALQKATENGHTKVVEILYARQMNIRMRNV